MPHRLPHLAATPSTGGAGLAELAATEWDRAATPHHLAGPTSTGVPAPPTWSGQPRGQVQFPLRLRSARRNPCRNLTAILDKPRPGSGPDHLDPRRPPLPHRRGPLADAAVAAIAPNAAARPNSPPPAAPPTAASCPDICPAHRNRPGERHQPQDRRACVDIAALPRLGHLPPQIPKPLLSRMSPDAARHRTADRRDFSAFAVSRFNAAGSFRHGSQTTPGTRRPPASTPAPALDRLQTFPRRPPRSTTKNTSSSRCSSVASTNACRRLPDPAKPGWGAHRFYVDEAGHRPPLASRRTPGRSTCRPGSTTPLPSTSPRSMPGSGCLAILAALALPNARVDAVVSPRTPSPWPGNVADYGLEGASAGRIHALAIAASFPDLIVSSPPLHWTPRGGRPARRIPARTRPGLGFRRRRPGLHRTTILQGGQAATPQPGGLLSWSRIGHSQEALEAAWNDSSPAPGWKPRPTA